MSNRRIDSGPPGRRIRGSQDTQNKDIKAFFDAGVTLGDIWAALMRQPVAILAVIGTIFALFLFSNWMIKDQFLSGPNVTATAASTPTSTATSTSKPTNTPEPTETPTSTPIPTVDPRLSLMPVRESYLVEFGKCRTLQSGTQQGVPFKAQLASRGRCEDVAEHMTLTLIDSSGRVFEATELTQEGCAKMLTLESMLDNPQGLQLHLCQTFPIREGEEGTPLFDLTVQGGAFPGLR